jgi:hypothetical protein
MCDWMLYVGDRSMRMTAKAEEAEFSALKGSRCQQGTTAVSLQ